MSLEALYNERLRVLPVVHEMEYGGVSVNVDRIAQLESAYKIDLRKAEQACHAVAKAFNYELELPKGPVNNSLKQFCFDVLKLPVMDYTDSGEPSLDKHALGDWLGTLPIGSKQYEFVKALGRKRKRDTSLSYLDGYRRFMLPMHPYGAPWYLLYPSLNPTGTATLRFSSSNPNEQNISKLLDDEGLSLRFAFGPPPGFEWWSLDAKNIELRIPAYESGEEAFIKLFERPDDHPYFGSNHLLIGHVLFPTEFEACRDDQGRLDGRIFKKRYGDSIYQRVKNGNFAVQYGAVDRPDGMGTADRTYGLAGAQAMIAARFTKQEALNQHWIAYANRYGYVQTMPDKTVDPTQGYPLLCTRTEWGKVKPTVPLNYHVQGTAMWWMMKAMIRCQAQLNEWGVGRIVMQVHDELVFEFPRRLRFGNLWRIRLLQKLMAEGGNDIGIPTPVSAEYHPEHWAEGITC